MASNFISGPNSSKDLDDVFVLRSDTTLGAPGSTIGTFKYNSTILESKYVRYTEVGLSEPGTPLINPTNFKYNTKDLAYVYVPPQDVQKICSYLTAAGKQKYGYGVPLFAWGANNYGQLGVGDTAARSSPTQVGTSVNWSVVTGCNPNVFGIQSDGSLWSWGYNLTGELGQDDVNVTRQTPTRVGNLTTWSKVAAGNSDANTSHVFAIQTNGTLWSWGTDSYGELGQTTRFLHRSSPTQVGSGTTWKEISAGYRNGFGILTNGTLWSWGFWAWGVNTGGAIVHRSSPTQVGTLSDWSKISASDAAPLVLAIKTTGTLWAWGVNTGGALGLNNIVHRSSPVQVGTLTGWQSVTCEYYTVAAVKTNGTLWAWGRNNYGQLGLNDTADRSSPTQVGLLTDWKEVNSGTQASAGIKTNGTLWAWGRNNYGAIGNNEPTVDRSSPIQVGSSTSWTSIKVASSDSQDEVFAIQSKTC